MADRELTLPTLRARARALARWTGVAGFWQWWSRELDALVLAHRAPHSSAGACGWWSPSRATTRRCGVRRSRRPRRDEGGRAHPARRRRGRRCGGRPRRAGVARAHGLRRPRRRRPRRRRHPRARRAAQAHRAAGGRRAGPEAGARLRPRPAHAVSGRRALLRRDGRRPRRRARHDRRRPRRRPPHGRRRRAAPAGRVGRAASGGGARAAGARRALAAQPAAPELRTGTSPWLRWQFWLPLAVLGSPRFRWRPSRCGRSAST